MVLLPLIATVLVPFLITGLAMPALALSVSSAAPNSRHRSVRGSGRSTMLTSAARSALWLQANCGLACQAQGD